MSFEHKYIKDYPRPQFVREDWMNLNGEWDFSFDDACVGEQQKWHKELPATHKIQVPFTYETEASGIKEEKFHPCVWYQRHLKLDSDKKLNRVKLHFQASDYVTKVWVNEVFVGQHQGGYTAFSFDITNQVKFDDDNKIVVCVEDSNSCSQPRGKQRWVKDNFACWYVQTTGIWQTVWLEYVAPIHLTSLKMIPDIDQGNIAFEYMINEKVAFNDLSIQTIISFNGKPIKSTETSIDRERLSVQLSVINESVGEWRLQLWSPNTPHLYDVTIHIKQNNKIIDTVYSYFGMRKISIEGNQILLNNRPLYQRLLLDQGYWETSHLTPPSEDALIEDIDKTLQLGFNGVRKHMKLEDARFLYWCDRKGLLVWSEMPATFEFTDSAVVQFTQEWMEAVKQYYNHPSIITWTPFNESWGIQAIYNDRKQQHFTESIYHLTKSFDSMRPVIVNDGWEHTISDIITLHDYEEFGHLFYERYQDSSKILSNDVPFNKNKFPFAKGYEYKGQPIIISEYGGIAFNSEKGWGYGNQVSNEEEFLERYASMTKAIKSLHYIVGFCYTQTTDVQQEVNGLMTIQRQFKVSPERIKEINEG